MQYRRIVVPLLGFALVTGWTVALVLDGASESAPATQLQTIEPDSTSPPAGDAASVPVETSRPAPTDAPTQTPVATPTRTPTAPAEPTVDRPPTVPGDSSSRVRSWQTLLNRWLELTNTDYGPLVVDGGFGEATVEATRRFEESDDAIPVDGIVQSTDRVAIRAAIAALEPVS